MVAKYLESEDSRELARLVREALESYRNLHGVTAIFGDVIQIDNEPLYNIIIYAPSKLRYGLSEYIYGFLAHENIETHYVASYFLSFRSLPE